MVPPDAGSRILFFSGGTALAPVAAELSRHTRNAVHVITTFDSGGSSAELRRAFGMPADMDLAGASIGNLVLTSGYLSLDRQLEPVVRVFSGMVQARGVVLPVADACAHLCVKLENGEVIVGQHRFTGKAAGPVTSPILDMWLTASLDDPTPVTVPVHPRLPAIIRGADLICYPVGSFFSSVMANLLPDGVSRAIREAACPKVFIPNLGTDPELFGLSVQDQVAYLLRLGGGGGGRSLDWLLVDEDESRLGVRVRRARLVAEPPYLDAGLLCRELLGVWK